MTPMKAIRAKCIECSGGSKSEVRHCPVNHCTLWAYRLGKRPPKVEKPELAGILDTSEGSVGPEVSP